MFIVILCSKYFCSFTNSHFLKQWWVKCLRLMWKLLFVVTNPQRIIANCAAPQFFLSRPLQSSEMSTDRSKSLPTDAFNGLHLGQCPFLLNVMLQSNRSCIWQWTGRVESVLLVISKSYMKSSQFDGLELWSDTDVYWHEAWWCVKRNWSVMEQWRVTWLCVTYFIRSCVQKTPGETVQTR